MFLYDAHCHLDAAAPTNNIDAGENRDVVGRLLCGVDPDDWAVLARVAAVWPGTTPAYGLHPWHIGSVTADWQDRLEQRLTEDTKAWLGEAGLDGLKTDAASPVRQSEVFAHQLRLAKRLGRAVNLHCVKAWEALLALLDTEYLSGGGGAEFIVHSFAGPHQFIEPLRVRGAYFTVGPLSSRRESPRHRRRAAALPAERLLLESDAFLRPGLDAREDLVHTLHWLARTRETDVEVLTEQIAENCRRLFNHG